MSSKIILPTYTTKLPSNGKSVKFRPFTVKEEKALLLALQEDSIETLAEVIKNVISVCTDGTINPTNIPYYDVEFLFLQIRAKSIGEVVELIGNCDCGIDKKTEFSIDIETASVIPAPTGNVSINIPDTKYTVEFMHPSIDDFVKTFHSVGNDAEQIVANCITNVFTDEEIMDWSTEEKLDFVLSMTTKQQKDIAMFLKGMPMVKLPAAFNCKHCGKLHEHTFSGFENFFV